MTYSMIHRLYFLLCAFLLTTSLMSLRAQTEVRLRAETNTFTRVPVELKPCQPLKQATDKDATRVLEILDNDLWMSSLIASFRTDEQLAGNVSPWLEIASLGPAGPFRLVVQSTVTIENDRLMLQAELKDGRGLTVLDKKEYRGCKDNLRLMVHSLADDIVVLLTGEKGIAQSQIVFTGQTGTSKELFVMDYDGTNVRQLTNNGSLNLTPAWSPNGRAIVLTSYVKGTPQLHFQDIQSRKFVRQVDLTGLQSAATWSPDGTQIAFASTHEGNSEIYVMDANGRSIRRLTHHWSIDSSPSWSPNSRQIVFTSDRLGGPQLFVMDAEGTNLRRLTLEGNYNDSAAWSPRGDKIVYVSRVDGRFNLISIDISGENAVQLTANEGSNEDPCWSPDGFRIVFSSTRGGSSDIYSMEWNGDNLRRLTYRGTCTSPAWSNNVRLRDDFECNGS